MHSLHCFIAFAAAALIFFGATHPPTLQAAAPELLQGFRGMRDDLCCMREQGAVCNPSPQTAACVPSGLYHCSCADHQQLCYRIHTPPRKHDLCVLPVNEPPHPLHCSYHTGPHDDDWCYEIEVGFCDDDGGPWSWLGFCWTCGCNYTNARIEQIGRRNLCSAASSPCP